MFAFELNGRLASRSKSSGPGLKLLQFLARRKRPARVPYDYREIERFKRELELYRAETVITSRFKMM
jgi:hypothetical protein